MTDVQRPEIEHTSRAAAPVGKLQDLARAQRQVTAPHRVAARPRPQGPRPQGPRCSTSIHSRHRLRHDPLQGLSCFCRTNPEPGVGLFLFARFYPIRRAQGNSRAPRDAETQVALHGALVDKVLPVVGFDNPGR